MHTPSEALFLAQIVLLLLVGRLMGEAMQRIGQPAVMGQLIVGILLVEDGIRIAKIFLHISAGEQIRRFKDRIKNPLKRWKLSYNPFAHRGLREKRKRWRNGLSSASEN